MKPFILFLFLSMMMFNFFDFICLEKKDKEELRPTCQHLQAFEQGWWLVPGALLACKTKGLGR